MAPGSTNRGSGLPDLLVFLLPVERLRYWEHTPGLMLASAVSAVSAAAAVSATGRHA